MNRNTITNGFANAIAPATKAISINVVGRESKLYINYTHQKLSKDTDRQRVFMSWTNMKPYQFYLITRKYIFLLWLG